MFLHFGIFTSLQFRSVSLTTESPIRLHSTTCGRLLLCDLDRNELKPTSWLCGFVIMIALMRPNCVDTSKKNKGFMIKFVIPANTERRILNELQGFNPFKLTRHSFCFGWAKWLLWYSFLSSLVLVWSSAKNCLWTKHKALYWTSKKWEKAYRASEVLNESTVDMIISKSVTTVCLPTGNGQALFYSTCLYSCILGVRRKLPPQLSPPKKVQHKDYSFSRWLLQDWLNLPHCPTEYHKPASCLNVCNNLKSICSCV